MRIVDDGTAVKLGYEGQKKSLGDYVAYMQALSVKPYLSAREASVFFDVGALRVRRIFDRPDMAEHLIKRGASPLMRRDIIEAALLSDGGEADVNE